MNDHELADKFLNAIFNQLAARLGHNPTYDELIDFIIGSQDVITTIWNNTYEEKN